MFPFFSMTEHPFESIHHHLSAIHQQHIPGSSQICCKPIIVHVHFFHVPTNSKLETLSLRYSMVTSLVCSSHTK